MTAHGACSAGAFFNDHKYGIGFHLRESRATLRAREEETPSGDVRTQKVVRSSEKRA